MELTLFPPDVALDIKHRVFLDTPLGQLHSSLPIAELAALLPEPETKVGAKPWFDNYGKVALQFLKAREGYSDEKLLERLNTDWALQFFCGIRLKDNEWIKDKDVIWKARAFVASHLDIFKAQEILISHWKPWMKGLHLGLCDASCYESYIKYPTDVKLLWDCIEWMHRCVKRLSREMGQPRPRNKYQDNKKRQLSYARKRRKTHKEERRMRRLLLNLCEKLLLQLGQLLEQWAKQEWPDETLFGEEDWQRYRIIGKIYMQQRFHYDNPGESVPDRIVSLYKPYLRPIVRGKENKRVEFGAKVHTWQVGGLNFLEHLSFKAFNESTRLRQGVAFHQKNFGKLAQLGGDDIYGTNANRRLCSKLGISNCFKPKGRRTHDKLLRQQEDQARKAIGTARATVLEGSYGNDKNHYGLRKVKARNELTEVTWIFFGMMTANAVKVSKRMHKGTAANAKARAA